MLTRRDLVALLWYCALFSTVVAWAIWRREAPARSDGGAIAAGAAPAGRGGVEPVRRRMVAP